eukprot:CCRYP_012258-RA/>CCRYP_012258-RA protein AED:0.00 eAED:0.00 QI:26/1/1/1/0/0/2/118/43
MNTCCLDKSHSLSRTSIQATVKTPIPQRQPNNFNVAPTRGIRT